MKTKIIKSISFVTILIVILVALSALYRPKNNSVEAGMHYRGASGILAEPENTIDMIVIGNSEAYTSIIPMELWNDYGYTSYVCASPEQILPVSVKILGESIKKQKPKVVMLEASNLNTTSDFSDASDQVLNYGLKVFQYHDRWKSTKKEDFGNKPEYNNVNFMKGYEFSDEVNGLEKQPTEEKKMDETAIPKSNQMYVKTLKKICDKNGAKFVIVSIPSFKYWSHETHNEIQNFCDKNKIEYLDLNLHKDEVCVDWTKDTSDNGEHLNYNGAIKTTKWIGKHLDERKYLKNHKNEEKYRHWDEEYNKYKSKAKGNNLDNV